MLKSGTPIPTGTGCLKGAQWSLFSKNVQKQEKINYDFKENL